MKATETKFLDFLKAPKQFIIPIYQRTYSWTLVECRQLWDDLLSIAKDDKAPGHFVGSVVYVERGLYHISDVPQLLVIDGQQRLTTLSLLIGALGREVDRRGELLEIRRKTLENYYLFNNEEEGELRFKLVLTQSDKLTLMRILEGKDLPVHPAQRLVENNRFFEEHLAKPSVDLMALYRAIAKLLIVDISLDRDHDSPQRIFESLNSTGLELTQADLIRNYILMGLEPKHQDQLYNEYWYPMEQSFGQSDYAALFDRFMRDYLTLKNGTIPIIREVYATFKVFASSGQIGTVDDLVADIYRYSKYFVNVGFGRESDPELRRAFADINTLKVDVAYPFLIDLYARYESCELDRVSFMAILRLVESYVFRRVICGIPTSSLSNTFAGLMRELNPANYLESCQAVLMLKDSYRRFPADAEFGREFPMKDIYHLRNRNYVLRKLENEGRKELVAIDEYTIEHILPQNPELSTEWKEELGEDWKTIQARYLHTIGNLTLTGYNPELSDLSFRTKRDMVGGFGDSPIRLNRSLARLERWTSTEIEARAAALADLASRVWTYPALDIGILEHYRKERIPSVRAAYTLADHSNMTGPTLELFEHLRKRILNLGSVVHEEILKLYIAYKIDTNFVDIVPQKTRLLVYLNMKFDEVIDPRNICRDVSRVGGWANGEAQFAVAAVEELEYAMELIRQAFENQVGPVAEST